MPIDPLLSTMIYEYLTTSGGKLALRIAKGTRHKPAVLWLGGFRSDITGAKVGALFEWAEANGRDVRAFDYFGHGASEGTMRDFTLSRGLENALDVFDSWKQENVILVGSSMGAWIGLRLIQMLEQRGEAEKIAGMVLIAPAPDFTEKLIWEKLSKKLKNEMTEKGFLLRPSRYSTEPYFITHALIEDGRKHLLLGKPYACPCPVHILQGLKDPDVPWQHALELVHALQGSVSLSLIKDGDHRLSTPDNIRQLLNTIEAID